LDFLHRRRFWEQLGIDECAAWAIVLADMVRHIGYAHEAEHGHDPLESVAKSRAAFEAEMENATTEPLGQVVN
jgi:hypothetical protein